MKELLKKCAWVLATPWRIAKRRRYSDPSAQAVARMELPNDQLLPLVREYVSKGEKVIINVKGYSMRPFLEHLRDRVKLAPWTTLQVGDAVLAEIAPGHFVLHRIIEMGEGGALTLMGDGNLRGTESCTQDDVCGLVIEYLRPNGHILKADDPALKRKIKLWRRLLPFRRLLLFIYKATI